MPRIAKDLVASCMSLGDGSESSGGAGSDSFESRVGALRARLSALERDRERLASPRSWDGATEEGAAWEEGPWGGSDPEPEPEQEQEHSDHHDHDHADQQVELARLRQELDVAKRALEERDPVALGQERRIRRLEKELRWIRDAIAGVAAAVQQQQHVQALVNGGNHVLVPSPAGGARTSKKQQQHQQQAARDLTPDERMRMFLLTAADAILPSSSYTRPAPPPLARLGSNQSSSSSTLRTMDSWPLPSQSSPSSSYRTAPPAPFLLGTSTSESLNAYARRRQPTAMTTSRAYSAPATAAPRRRSLANTTAPSGVVAAIAATVSQPPPSLIGSRERRRLETEILVLNDEYRELYREGAARTPEGLARLRWIVSAIEDKEMKLRG